MGEFDDPLGKVAVDFGHRFSNGHGGWLRLGITLLVWLLTVGYFARGIIDAQSSMQESLKELSTNMAHLAGEVSRLATANDVLNEHIKYSDEKQAEAKRRLDRLEDGRKQ